MRTETIRRTLHDYHCALHRPQRFRVEGLAAAPTWTLVSLVLRTSRVLLAVMAPFSSLQCFGEGGAKEVWRRVRCGRCGRGCKRRRLHTITRHQPCSGPQCTQVHTVQYIHMHMVMHHLRSSHTSVEVTQEGHTNAPVDEEREAGCAPAVGRDRYHVPLAVCNSV